MYQALKLADDQKDLHLFLWREDPKQSFQHYRMTRLTFGVSALSFVANMVLRKNAQEHLETDLQTAQMALLCFYVDDGLMDADSICEAIQLWKESRDLFKQGGFELKKWKSSEEDFSEVLASIPEEMKDVTEKQEIRYKDEYTKVP